MNIAILGYGRMGHTVESAAVRNGHRICAIFDLDNPLKTDSNLKDAEVIISFSCPQAVIPNLRLVSHMNLPIVEGTTGWYHQLDRMKQIENLTILYSPNFSIGVYQFGKLLEAAARLFGSLPDYDCYIHEWHHRHKADSPSGTALKLADILIKNARTKSEIMSGTYAGTIEDQALHVTSTRVGRIPGTHEVGFDSEHDTITLRHQAHGRTGFAVGALKAAEWLIGKKGIYTMDDFMESLTQTH
ncbi:MAG: 4-hydroxy-tetrahydrodipicolinate reductase [Fidelibacterota bacterium]